MLRTTCFILAVFLAGSAAAQDRGLYAGGAFGNATARDVCGGLASCDDNDLAWKAFGGYRFTRNSALEVGYADLGKISLVTGAARTSIKASAFDLAGIFSLPLGSRAALLGRLGGFYATSKASSNFGFSVNESKSGFTYGAGARLEISRAVGLRAEWQRYHGVGGGALRSTDIDVLWLALQTRF